jgi:hypothetical protein
MIELLYLEATRRVTKQLESLVLNKMLLIIYKSLSGEAVAKSDLAGSR